MINLIDAVQRIIDEVPIQHGTSDIFRVRNSAVRRRAIEVTHFVTLRDQRRNQVLSDEAAAAGDEDPCHARGCDPPSE